MFCFLLSSWQSDQDHPKGITSVSETQLLRLTRGHFNIQVFKVKNSVGTYVLDKLEVE